MLAALLLYLVFIVVCAVIEDALVLFAGIPAGVVLIGGMLYVCYRKLRRIEERLQAPPQEAQGKPGAGQDSP